MSERGVGSSSRVYVFDSEQYLLKKAIATHLSAAIAFLFHQNSKIAQKNFTQAFLGKPPSNK
ncbi:MAG: hypothetical protein PUP91_31490 [Rhizonema sp. PD37]|nr:hypothetical protein [Rhizonema sp. PD37]